jgi:hypothetical protein
MVPALCDPALTIGICPQRFRRKLLPALLVALALSVSACGDDDDESSTAPGVTETTATGTTTEAVPTETEAEAEPPPAETTPSAESPEDEPGGAGDEEPARTLALFTARDGRITPRVVRVPAFISIQVELRSADGAVYSLRFGDTMITAGADLNSVSTTIDGLRPNEAIVGTPRGAGNRVRIEATAEPGP